jgi:hypothetical protein
LIWLALLGGMLFGFVAGFTAGAYVMAKVLQDEWRELRALLVPAQEQPQQDTPEWDMRVSPERYLERLPEGEHAPLARSIVERRAQAARQQRAAPV